MSIEEIFTRIPVLETDHYILRGMTEKDAREMFQFMGDRQTMKFIKPDPVQNQQEMLQEIEDRLEKYGMRKEIPWVIETKAAGELIGTFSLHKLHLFHRKAEMGAVIREDFQRKGVMSEIIGEILEFGFGPLKLNRIVGDIFAHNEGSERLLAKFGFRKEGVLRQTDFDGERYHDTVVFSLLKAEYEAVRSRV